jgi:PAS domain S-box-containing protein
MCWDLFMERYLLRLEQADSLMQLREFAQLHHWRIDWNLEKLVVNEQRVVLVTNTEQVICFASANMIGMNGYLPDEVFGKQPKMFQGKDTEPDVRKQIREAIVRRLPFSGSIVNYRKDGTPYHCLVDEYPVWNKQGRLVHFIAFEKIAS